MNETNLLGSTQMLHKLAVIKLIRELEMQETMLSGMINGSKDEIVALGVEYGIAYYPPEGHEKSVGFN